MLADPELAAKVADAPDGLVASPLLVNLEDPVAGGEVAVFVVPAGIRGTISQVLVADGQAVRLGQPLFEVVPTM